MKRVLRGQTSEYIRRRMARHDKRKMMNLHVFCRLKSGGGVKAPFAPWKRAYLYLTDLVNAVDELYEFFGLHRELIIHW